MASTQWSIPISFRCPRRAIWSLRTRIIMISKRQPRSHYCHQLSCSSIKTRCTRRTSLVTLDSLRVVQDKLHSLMSTGILIRARRMRSRFQLRKPSKRTSLKSTRTASRPLPDRRARTLSLIRHRLSLSFLKGPHRQRWTAERATVPIDS